MVKYFGNCSSIINWDDLLNSIKDQEPSYVGPRHRYGDPAPGINEVATLWYNAGYKPITEGGNASWDMFMPGTNFDMDIVHKFAEFVGLDGYTNCWISRINPGYVAPWHWDVTDDEVVLSMKDCIRYHCHIQRPEDALGHALIVENSCLYGQEQGEVYRWPARKSWHGGANCGLKPMYTFNFWY